MGINNQFHHEDVLNTQTNNQVTSFWQQGLFDAFSGVNEINIHYASFTHDKPSSKNTSTPSIILVPGRCETYLKYKELSFNLFLQGYDVFIIDHRGQGLSGRLLQNPHKGYVSKFQDYVDDLRYFVEKIVFSKCVSKPYMLAHSMGAAIAARFMQDSPDAIKAAVISSPMIGFHSGSLPFTLAKKMVSVQLMLNNMLSKDRWYFFGQKNYSTLKFSKNNLTHSKIRYEKLVELYQQNKSIQLGGVTAHWLQECLDGQKEIFTKLDQLTTPILLLQAGEDSIVSRQAQDDFCRQLHTLQPQSCPNGRPIKIEGAFHELFFELDDFRNQAIKQSLAWFDKNP